MFDIYSLAKPRVFMAEHDGGGTPSEIFAPDSVQMETAALQLITTVDAEEAEEVGHPEAEGRIAARLDTDIITNNLINAASDLGGRIRDIGNSPITREVDAGHIVYRTEFRPKQGLHNLDFTTPAETPSDDQGGADQAQ